MYPDGPFGPCFSVGRVARLIQGTIYPWKRYSEVNMKKLFSDIVKLNFIRPTIEIAGQFLSAIKNALMAPNPVNDSVNRSASAGSKWDDRA